MLVMGIKSFSLYIASYEHIKAKAVEWPIFVNDDSAYQNAIVKYPKKYVNWIIWVLMTAPRVKTEEEEKTKTILENLLAEVLSIKGVNDIIEHLYKLKERKFI